MHTRLHANEGPHLCKVSNYLRASRVQHCMQNADPRQSWKIQPNGCHILDPSAFFDLYIHYDQCSLLPDLVPVVVWYNYELSDLPEL